MTVADLYERDFYQWALRNAQLLRKHRFEEADVTHIAEELEEMGKRERRALLSRLSALISHLLKWQLQPERRSRSWEATIRLQRREIARLLAEMPSLKRWLADHLEEAYGDAVVRAVADTGLAEEDFPERPPFELDQILEEGFLP